MFDLGVYNDILFSFEDATGRWVAALVPLAQSLFLLLAALELVWTGIRHTLSARESGVTSAVELLLRKLIYFAFCFWFIRAAPAALPYVVASFQRAGGAATGITALHPSSFLASGAASSLAILEGLHGAGFLTDPLGLLVAFSGVIFSMAAFALMAATITMTLVETMLAIGATVFLLPFAATRWTCSLAEGALAFVFRSAVKLFVVYLLAGTVSGLTTVWAERLRTSAFIGPIDYLTWYGCLLTLALLLWTAPLRVAGSVVPSTLRFGLTPAVGDN
jgi:type IV secretion system protein TrbL